MQVPVPRAISLQGTVQIDLGKRVMRDCQDNDRFIARIDMGSFLGSGGTVNESLISSIHQPVKVKKDKKGKDKRDKDKKDKDKKDKKK